MPARDEADRIAGCLRALLDQRDLDGRPLGEAVRILVLANNCRDATAEVAAAVDARVRVVSVELCAPDATAGGARRAAMDAAAALLPAAGMICCTDADSRPRPDWVARLWAGLDRGAGAVAGAIDLEAEAGAPIVVSPGRRLEAAYSALQAELTARLDPEPHNPWPNHIWAWGANLAVTSEAYRRVGGLPPMPLAEDRAFVERLRRHDVPVRHCLEARVWTSARRVGRAPGGLADLVADHAGADLAPCDHALEPADDAARRANARREAREAYGSGRTAALARRLDLPIGVLAVALAAPTFGEAWEAIERAAPTLARRRLTPADLPAEIAGAERLLGALRRGDADDRRDSAIAATAGLWSAEAPPA